MFLRCSSGWESRWGKVHETESPFRMKMYNHIKSLQSRTTLERSGGEKAHRHSFSESSILRGRCPIWSHPCFVELDPEHGKTQWNCCARDDRLLAVTQFCALWECIWWWLNALEALSEEKNGCTEEVAQRSSSEKTWLGDAAGM